ncbi:MAG: hypothetical protein M0036_20320, partial [Desulfobacteraceae bacterium]|nr:hypothetical protein [Desulfobacteraceae bacterium]
MQLTFDHDLRYLQFSILKAIPGVWHAVLARSGVAADGSKVPFNLGLNGHEPESEVWGRRRRVTALASAHVAVFAHQVHGAQVAVWEDGA